MRNVSFIWPFPYEVQDSAGDIKYAVSAFSGFKLLLFILAPIIVIPASKVYFFVKSEKVIDIFMEILYNNRNGLSIDYYAV